MGWLDWISPSHAGTAAAVGDIAIETGAHCEGAQLRGVRKSGARDASGAPLSEEIKRRQVALVVRYVMTMRAR